MQGELGMAAALLASLAAQIPHLTACTAIVTGNNLLYRSTTSMCWVLQGELGVAAALLANLAAQIPHLKAASPAEDARLAGQLRLLAALIKALDRRSLGTAGRGDLVGLLIRGALDHPNATAC